MRIVRFVDDAGNTRYGCEQPDGTTTLLEGDIYGQYRDTGRALELKRLP